MAVDAFVLQRLVAIEPHETISAVEMSDTSFWIGTTSGVLKYYLLGSGRSSSFACNFSVEGNVSEKNQPIVAIKGVSGQGKLLVLCEGRLSVFFQSTLTRHTTKESSSKRFTKVDMFCLDCNCNPAEDAEVGVTIAQGKKLVSLDMVNGQLTTNHQLREQPVAGQVQRLIRSENIAVYAAAGRYNIVNLRTGGTMDLPDYDSKVLPPLLHWVGPSEFVLGIYCDPQTLGMCFNTNGEPVRAPLQWAQIPEAAAVSQPYIVALCPSIDTLVVHSIADQQLVQLLEFRNGLLVADTGHRILAIKSREVFVLHPVPIEMQLQSLLEAGRIDEALSLADTTYGRIDYDAMDQGEIEENQQLLRRTRQSAGFAALQSGQFPRGFTLLAQSETPPEHIVLLFPLVANTSKTPQSTLAALTGLETLQPFAYVIAEHNLKEADVYLDLAKHLLNIRPSAPVSGKRTIDTACTIIFAQYDQSQLVSVLQLPDPHCDISICEPKLEELKCFHMLAWLLAQRRDHEHLVRALHIWKRIQTDAACVDSTYPGARFVINFLQSLLGETLASTSSSNGAPPSLTPGNVCSVIEMHAQWLLDAEPEAGVRLFIVRNSRSGTVASLGQSGALFSHDTVLDTLDSYPLARIAYLEHLVFDRKTHVETFHTKLATSLLDLIKRKNFEIENRRATTQVDDSDLLAPLLERLIRVLKESPHYNVHVLIPLLEGTPFHTARAYAYGRAERYEDALQIFVHELANTELAEQYCDDVAGEDRELKQTLFYRLLKVYLDPMPGKLPLTREAIEMLNSEVSDLDVSAVISILPDSWTVQRIAKFLRQGLQRDLHHKHSTMMRRALLKSKAIQLGDEKVALEKQTIEMEENAGCMVCGSLLALEGTVSAFYRYPNGVIACKNCAKDPTTCPLTSVRFKLRNPFLPQDADDVDA
eukprot:m.106954 g.106954  ORF g.106954 m.106954 type:complete len:927 (+) comp13313_c0_seq2:202-2982(+)